ncbi:F0F1 ATP synthase subunit A [Govanella unica]|uniref:ATP synthase subunit a n=1 Tax=Govanella unica TaxID=2975056 RepID=A0A9X3TXB0_9PROT|nr:F0F1 ATP synthase subunit A [Govania unica]
MSAEHHSPLAQFEIKRLVPIEVGGYDISFTNASLFMLVTLAAVSLFMLVGMRNRSLVPGRWQMMVEGSYGFIANMLKDTAGKGSEKFFPFVFTLFMFVLGANLVGMMPYSFTVTSHIIVTFALAAVVFLLVTIVGFVKHGPKFLKLFVPSGVPIVMLPVITVIEVISYLSRPLSLSVRLFANMLAGHTMLKVFGGFVAALGFFGILPVAFMVALMGLEFVVAILQAYVFAVLTCIYLNDALHMH